MKVVYLLGGLGADERVFHSLDLSGFQTFFLDWIGPVASDTLESYSQRLSEQIKHPTPLLVGVSFGGMIAVEISKKVKVEKVILISSSISLPWHLKLAGVLKLQYLMPPSIFKRADFLIYWLFGVTQVEERQLLTTIINETDEQFLKWAINGILKWKPQVTSHDVVQIHGSNDRILPAPSQVDYLIDGGGHFMIVSKAREISVILAGFK
jgi:pimeloyl-ACP methyl ester carboxylesterase